MISDRLVYSLSIIVLIIIYGVGLIGFLNTYKALMIRLTPLTLLLSLLLLLINHREWNRFFVIFFISIVLAGILIEVIGVETGLLFGRYTYGTTLGYKVFNVPLLIGINWFLLVYSSGMISNLIKTHWFWKALIGAFLMVALDISLEPVASAFNFWTWENDIIPVRNYIFWFIISFIFQCVFQSLDLERINRFSVVLFIVQWIFFMILSFTINS